MLYGENKLDLTLKNIVDLFGMNDKSIVIVIKQGTDEELFNDRVDYLQYTIEGDMHELCSEKIKNLDVGKDSLIVYI